MNEVLDWIKAHSQVDFGNALVGLATLCLALVTVWLGLRSSKRETNYRVASFRQIWVDELRKELSEFVSVSESCNNLTQFHYEGSVAPNRDLLGMLAKQMSLDFRIQLRLNDQERSHKILKQLLEQVRGRSQAFAAGLGFPGSPQKLAEESRQLIFQIPPVGRVVLKTEWRRVKAEIGNYRPNKTLNSSELKSLDDADEILNKCIGA